MNAISRRELRAFDREIADIIVEAVNKHGVHHRMLDGRHCRLYCGDRDIIPIKISAVRPARWTMTHLLPWLEKNVPTWLDDHEPLRGTK